jgi:hypothetical protein
LSIHSGILAQQIRRLPILSAVEDLHLIDGLEMLVVRKFPHHFFVPRDSRLTHTPPMKHQSALVARTSFETRTRVVGYPTRRKFLRQMAGVLAGAAILETHAEEAVKHRFLCCDYQGNKVAIVAADGTVEWEVEAEHPQDCWLLRDGQVLFCHRTGVRQMNREKQIVMEYKAPAGAECHSCQPLADGGVLVAECGLSRLVEVGRDGKLSREIKVESKAKNMGHQFRGTRRTADGHYWTCLMDEKKVVELGADGALLRTIPVDGDPHAVVKLAGDHLLITLGPAGKVIELDEKLNIVWQLGPMEVPGNPLRLPAGCQRLPDGNTIICNYLGGGFMGQQPQAFEISRHACAPSAHRPAPFFTTERGCVIRTNCSPVPTR